MSLAPRLEIRQSQSLVMTPQLQQAIKLLAMSNLELDAFVDAELERNPLLERAGDVDGADGSGMDRGEGDPPAAADRLDRPDPVDPDAARAGHELGDAAALFGEDAAAGLSDTPSDRTGLGDSMAGPGAGSGGGSGGGGEGGEDGFDFDRLSDDGPTLADHLLAQAGLVLSGADLLLAHLLIGHIDEAGYLRARLLDIAQSSGAPLARIEGVLAVIQTFEPTGVGARDLAECLALQAREADRYDPAMARLIGHLDLVARGALGQLKRVCGVDDADLADMLAELRAYDPKPGCRIGAGRIEAVVPDLFVRRRAASGRTPAGWVVELNAATLPRVLMNRAYHDEVLGACATARRRPDEKRPGAATRAWLGEQVAGATWLTRALDQRQATILKVATELVRRQHGFFERGVDALQALTLKQVADAIGMHESTVSRVTTNKYLACARGTFELKYFFSSGIAADGRDQAMSAAAVKARIKALIDQEDAILSDDAIAARLKADGLDIARRTVVKYRESMGIGSSIQRRRARAIGR